MHATLPSINASGTHCVHSHICYSDLKCHGQCTSRCCMAHQAPSCHKETHLATWISSPICAALTVVVVMLRQPLQASSVTAFLPAMNFTYHLVMCWSNITFPKGQWVLAAETFYTHKNQITAETSSEDHVCSQVTILKHHGLCSYVSMLPDP